MLEVSQRWNGTELPESHFKHTPSPTQQGNLKMQNMLDEWDLVEYFEGILRSLNVNDNVQDLINGTAAQIVDDVERQV